MKLSAHTVAVKKAGRKALVPYFTAGYPDEATFTSLLAAAARAGCPVIEVGIPFSDPVADGPVIQEAGGIALRRGGTLSSTLDLCAASTITAEVDLVAMSYLNPILALGIDTFAQRAEAAGFGGVILPDVPKEESAPLRATLAGHNLTLIDLVAPTSGAERIRAIAAEALSFLYLVSMTGVTGGDLQTDEALLRFVREVKTRTQTPCYVGFGIGTPAQAATICHEADGVVIGSALTRIIRGADTPQHAVAAVEHFLCTVNAAMNGAFKEDRR